MLSSIDVTSNFAQWCQNESARNVPETLADCKNTLIKMRADVVHFFS